MNAGGFSNLSLCLMSPQHLEGSQEDFTPWPAELSPCWVTEEWPHRCIFFLWHILLRNVPSVAPHQWLSCPLKTFPLPSTQTCSGSLLGGLRGQSQDNILPLSPPAIAPAHPPSTLFTVPLLCLTLEAEAFFQPHPAIGK